MFGDGMIGMQGGRKYEGEFVLPYEEMRNAADPDAALLLFLQKTYEAAAECAGWDRKSLEVSS